MRIPIRYSNPWRWILTILLLPPRFSYIRIDRDTVKVRMGWAFRAKFSRATVQNVRDYRTVVSIGAHGWKGRWLVNGAHRPIAEITLSPPTYARLIGFPVALRQLYVSVEDRDVLRLALLG
jgi:hypothetical protein